MLRVLQEVNMQRLSNNCRTEYIAPSIVTKFVNFHKRKQVHIVMVHKIRKKQVSLNSHNIDGVTIGITFGSQCVKYYAAFLKNESLRPKR